MSGMGRYRPVAAPFDFQPGHLLCWPERPGSAKSGHSNPVLIAIHFMNNPKRDLLSSQWKSVASALEIEFIAPMSLRLPDGTNYEFACLLPQFGGRSGMLIGVEHSAIASAAAIAAGYGVSSMSPEHHCLPVNASDFVECLIDWGWGGSCAAPQWYIDAS